jgi:DME family drug/metabolite transporter
LAEPLTATLLGVFILGEHLGSQEALGIFLIFMGILVLSIASSRRPNTAIRQLTDEL